MSGGRGWAGLLPPRAPLAPILCAALIQTGFRWPGLWGGAPEAASALLLPALLVCATLRGQRWWAARLSFFTEDVGLGCPLRPMVGSGGRGWRGAELPDHCVRASIPTDGVEGPDAAAAVGTACFEAERRPRGRA